MPLEKFKMSDKAREYYLSRGNDSGPDALTHICLFEYYPDLNPIVLVEKSAYAELLAKYNFMVDSAQQNAKERDELQEKITRWHADHDAYFIERGDALERQVKAKYEERIAYMPTIRERDELMIKLQLAIAALEGIANFKENAIASRETACETLAKIRGTNGEPETKP